MQGRNLQTCRWPTSSTGRAHGRRYAQEGGQQQVLKVAQRPIVVQVKEPGEQAVLQGSTGEQTPSAARAAQAWLRSSSCSSIPGRCWVGRPVPDAGVLWRAGCSMAAAQQLDPGARPRPRPPPPRPFGAPPQLLRPCAQAQMWAPRAGSRCARPHCALGGRRPPGSTAGSLASSSCGCSWSAQSTGASGGPCAACVAPDAVDLGCGEVLKALRAAHGGQQRGCNQAGRLQAAGVAPCLGGCGP